jgi:Cys-tRNA(Pro)/Cys-tRNA(Cys) deacylase
VVAKDHTVAWAGEVCQLPPLPARRSLAGKVVELSYQNIADALVVARHTPYIERMKTNAVRLLESLGVQYGLREYDVDPDDLAAETVAAKIGMPPEHVFKTLLARGDRHGLCFAVVPANTELDLKALAAATGDRKMELAPVKELLALTGYIRGGVTVLGAKKAFPVFADETIQLWDSISISAGVRGTQIILRPEDYLRATAAVMADIARGKS